MFKLNLVQTDLRRRLDEDTKEDKVHRKNDTNVQNNKSSKPFVDESPVEEKEILKKRFMTINAEKNSGKYIEIKVQKDQENIAEASSGMFIDKKK